jgi:response regulator RpfG family c-di-GMP phosphodiesterase
VVIIDLGLPDGNGSEVADLVAQKVDPKPGVLILSAADEDVARKAAEDCGADGYLPKPIENLGAFQAAVLDVLPGGAAGQPDWNSEFSTQMSGTDFFEQDLENALDLFEEALKEDDTQALAFGAQFLAGVASTAADQELEQCARAVSARLNSGHRGLAAAGTAVDVLSSRLRGDLSATG